MMVKGRRGVGTFSFLGATGGTGGTWSSYSYSPQLTPVAVTASGATGLTSQYGAAPGVQTLPVVAPGATTANLAPVTVSASKGLSATQWLVIAAALGLAAFVIFSGTGSERHA
jgi:hypothetical protein